jgi:endoglucanase
MDEVGLLITSITSEGLLRFNPIGIDPIALFGRKVMIGKEKVTGVIGAKVWHHLEKSERETALKSEDLFIDIGATSREEAGLAVCLGDSATFCDPFHEFGDGLIISRALDNRIGCSILIDLLANGCPVP